MKPILLKFGTASTQMPVSIKFKGNTDRKYYWRIGPTLQMTVGLTRAFLQEKNDRRNFLWKIENDELLFTSDQKVNWVFELY